MYRMLWGAGVLTGAFAAALSAQEIRSGEEITVERVLVDARVTDYDFNPITDLTAADFEVRIDGKLATIESVEWVPETLAARQAAGLDEVPETLDEVEAPPGRLFIWFFQTDFARVPSRVSGQMKFLTYADELIDSLEPNDRVAVFSFDSHLKFRLDFTDDKRALHHTIRAALAIDDPPPPPVVPMPSLARRLDRQEMRNSTSSEHAFILIANALRHIPGPKSMVLFGWGLGQLSGGRVVMTPKYQIARHAMESARVTVFALDMTVADYHDLELGLGQAAADTGGFYAKTHIFPRVALNRLQKTLAGHYELEVRKPPTDRRGTHTIDVRVKRRGTYVMARTSYVDG
ncbi:MAG TPA: VWA domain-containing protein [Thermoanaerobaculia bacterium]|nr:VWA domain-containing protein [Thermoanaerobaculia bacterium]